MEPLKVNLLVQDALHACSKRWSLLAEFALQVDKKQGIGWEEENVISPILYGTWMSFLQQSLHLTQASRLLHQQCPGTLRDWPSEKVWKRQEEKSHYVQSFPAENKWTVKVPLGTGTPGSSSQPRCCSPAGCPARVWGWWGDSSFSLPYITTPQGCLADVCLSYSRGLLVIEKLHLLQAAHPSISPSHC